MNAESRIIAAIATGISLSFFCRPITAQDSTEQEQAFKQFRMEAADYEFQTIEPKATLKMHQQPLLHWSNPARNGENGAVFLWTRDDTPFVVGTCFTYTYGGEKRRKHAFHILSSGGVKGTNRGRLVWAPAPNQISSEKFPKAPLPASTRSQQKRQMRLLARKLEVTLSQKDGRQESCRLVPQPLYQFASANGEHVGAIFSFAIGTDPEALLLIDTRKDDSGRLTWHYSFARFTFYPLEAKLDETSVWKVERSRSLSDSILVNSNYQKEPYITFRAEWLD